MTDQAPSATPGWFHPSGRPYRFTVLLFVAFLTYGSYFAYDAVGAIESTLMKAWGVDQEAIGGMYTMYSVAAILTLFAGGLIIDKFGTRRASLFFSALVTVGAIVVAMAPNLTTAYVGRFIFGWGSESLVVAQSAILARWFTGKELALSFGVSLTISRLGTLFTFNTEEAIAKHFGSADPMGGARAALWAAAFFCIISLVGNLVYILMDRHGEKALGLKEEGGGDKIVLADIAKFGKSFWFVTALCTLFYSAVFPFTALSTDFFHEKWGLPLTATTEGGFLAQVFSNFLHMTSTAPGTSSVIIFASMVFAPFAGGMVDKLGRRGSMMVLGALLMIPAHACMGFTTIPPLYPMIMLGAAFVLVPAAMWPSIPLLVDKQRVGTAFGLTTMVQNVGLALFPWLNGRLRVMTNDYTASMTMFASLGALAFVFAILLLGSDRAAGGVLEKRSVKKDAAPPDAPATQAVS